MVMKKQILSLIACATFFASNPAFCMFTPDDNTWETATKKQLQERRFEKRAQEERPVRFEYYNACFIPRFPEIKEQLDRISVSFIDEKNIVISGSIEPLKAMPTKFNEQCIEKCILMAPNKVQERNPKPSYDRSHYSSAIANSAYYVDRCDSSSRIGVRVTFKDPVVFDYNSSTQRSVVLDFSDLLMPYQPSQAQQIKMKMAVIYHPLQQVVIEDYILRVFVVPDETLIRNKQIKLWPKNCSLQGKTFELPAGNRCVPLQGQKIIFVLDFAIPTYLLAPLLVE